MTDDHATALLDMTVAIVTKFVSNNLVGPEALAGLIVSTHAALAGAGMPAPEVAEAVAKPSTSQIRKSVSEAGLVSFIDGRAYQSLKRHLGSHGFTPESYRETYGLRSDYPMVNPAYAARRSALAKAMGLGQGGRKPPRPPKAPVSTGKAGPRR